jgi:hypothetical protein
MFFLDAATGAFLSHFMADRLGEEGYRSAHMGLPVPTTDGRQLIVNAWYLGGTNLVDFADATKPGRDGLLYRRSARARRFRQLVGVLVRRPQAQRAQRDDLRHRRRPRPRGRSGNVPMIRHIPGRRRVNRRPLRPPQPADPREQLTDG